MSAVTARAFPAITRIRSTEFRPRPVVTRGATWGGDRQAVDVGPTLWSASYQTAPLTVRQADDWEVWLDGQRGGVRTCKAYDTRRQFPRDYANGFGGLTILGGGAFSGVGHVAALSSTTVTVEDLPVGFQFRAGDQFSISRLDGQAFFRLEADAIVDGSGQVGLAATLPVPPDLLIGADVVLERPWFEGVIDLDSITTTTDVDQKTLVGFLVWQRHGQPV